ncbi:MAG: FAD-dependent oxidoreductase [Acidobacteriota bacterium]|nr:FAD-dependent oxidoreductase [Acidobacteriota bacterium]
MIVIIGAGTAGLTCAKYLKDKGVDALVLESSDGVGGRVRTDNIKGFKLDRGFQVLLTSYPEAEQLLNYKDLRLKTLPSGARIRNGSDFFVMPNPLKDIWTAPQALFSPVGSLLDKAKVLQLNLETRNAAEPDDAANRIPNESTISFLRNYGYSETIINRFFEPFFRGVFLEKELETSSKFFKFLYNQFAKGDVVIPENGMQAIPEQIAAHLSPNQIRLNTTVKKISGKTVCLDNGEIIEADNIVLATDAKTAAKLLGEESKVEFNSTVCLYFESDVPLNMKGEPYLVINSNTDELIDHLLVMSDVVPTSAPAGKTLISVSIVGNKDVSDDVLEEKVQAELVKWFGKEDAWRHLKTYQIPEALPQFFQNSATESNLKVNDHTYRCGDYTAYPSLNAAMKTGREVAEMLY